MNNEKTTFEDITEAELISAESSADETQVEESTVVEHDIGFTPAGLQWSLPIMGKGMLGIFIVTAIIVAVTAILNKATTPRKNK